MDRESKVGHTCRTTATCTSELKLPKRYAVSIYTKVNKASVDLEMRHQVQESIRDREAIDSPLAVLQLVRLLSAAGVTLSGTFLNIGSSSLPFGMEVHLVL